MHDYARLRVSDQERDETLELLRGHLLAGRLEPEEHEERVAEACCAKYGADLEHALRELPRPAPAAVPGPPTFVRADRDGRPGTALALGVTGIGLLMITAAFGFALALPFSLLAWIIGARAAKLPPEVVGPRGRATARTGMWLGVTGTIVAFVAFAVLLMLIVA